MENAIHAFDRALALQPAAGDVNRYQGVSSQDYWNMVGPFGGVTAATVMQAVLRHPARIGQPVALTVNYVAPVAPGSYTITAIPVRTNRSTQHWTIEISQPGIARGAEESDKAGDVVVTGTVMTALRRDTWSNTEATKPDVPAPSALQRYQLEGQLPWFSHYELIPIAGDVPAQWDGSMSDSLTQLWMRDAPPRPLDFASLTAMSDMFYSRIWLRRAKRVPMGTVSLTTYFHADETLLKRVDTGYLLGQARGQGYFKGFHDQTAQIWSEQGDLLVTTHQAVYYKE